MRNCHLGVAAFCVTTVLSGVSAQTEWSRAPLLAHHAFAAGAWDPVRGCLVVFGGSSTAGRSGDTWEWHGADWSRLTPAVSPSPRDSAAMVFDPLRGSVVLFGGRTAAGDLADTWEWHGSAWTLRAPVASPGARSLAAMTWDGGRQRLLLFGGRNGSTQLGDSWEWDGANWSQRSPLHAPTPRAGAAMAWDAVRDRVVLFGGGACFYWACGSNDTWEWDGTDWTDVSPPWSARPEPRWQHTMAYDVSRNRVVVFGGSDDPGHYKSDTWEWDGATWTAPSTVHEPVARLGHVMAHDAVTARTLVAGGESFYGTVSDLWALDAVDWQLVHMGQQPNAGFYETAEMAFDGDQGGVLWCGMGLGVIPQPQTWLWRDEGWTLQNIDQGPQWPIHYRLQWLPSRHRVILHQPLLYNQSEQTWEFDGGSWTQLNPVHMPGAGDGLDVALDPRLGRIVLFGGRVGSAAASDQTWLFDGVDWVLASPTTSPSGREGHAMTLDAPRSRVVLFGGRTAQGLVDDTWEWDGDNWAPRTPVHAPTPRENHRLAFDYGRRRTILQGGVDASGTRTDTWEWDGVDWLQRQTVTAPSASFGQGLAHDATTGQTVSMLARGDGTWRYGPTSPARFDLFGTGCGGSLGAPVMLPELGQRPHIGTDFRLLFFGLPGPFAIGVFGFSNTTWFGAAPLPFDLGPLGYPGCDLLVQGDFVTLVPLLGGDGSWDIPIPLQPGLIGLQFFNQVLALDAAGPTGLATTRGGAGIVGGR